MAKKLKRGKKTTARKKPKVIVGWQKTDAGYIYHFKDTVSKKFGIKKIDFPGFKEQPVGLNLYGTGGGFNMRQSNKVGGSFL